MGFKAVRLWLCWETAVGAKYVTREYLHLLEKGEMENIISSACPSVNMYIEKYYPKLTKYIAPVMSPALVHGKMLKEKYGKDTKVVFRLLSFNA